MITRMARIANPKCAQDQNAEEERGHEDVAERTTTIGGIIMRMMRIIVNPVNTRAAVLV